MFSTQMNLQWPKFLHSNYYAGQIDTLLTNAENIYTINIIYIDLNESGKNSIIFNSRQFTFAQSAIYCARVVTDDRTIVFMT